MKALARRPVILENKCIRCGACVAACPVEGKAVSFRGGKDGAIRTDGKKEPPVYDYKKCIRCYCCQEMCPERAIVVKRKFI